MISKKTITSFCLAILVALSPLHCSEGNYVDEEDCFYVMKNPFPNTKAGFFAVFDCVLCLLDGYENGNRKWSGVEVDFGTEGVYWVADKGSNWWQYYFDPICIGSKLPEKVESVDITWLMKHDLCRWTPHEIAYFLIKKHIKVKDEILEAVDEFYENSLKNSFVIGVHYRGTDKDSEAPRVSYDTVYLKILEILKRESSKKVKIFVATDECHFIAFLTSKFPDLVYYTRATRATDSLPVHMYHNKDPYKIGKEALIDCLLLSKCDVLIRTESNLSNTSLMFNPKLESYTLNGYYKEILEGSK